MANANFNIPFIPQEGITQQILTAIQLANEQHQRNLQNQLIQPQIAEMQARTGLATAQTGLAQTQGEVAKTQLDMRRRMLGYVFGNPDLAGTQTSAEQPSSFPQDAAKTKARLDLNPTESAAYDSAVKRAQISILTKGDFDTSELDKVINERVGREKEKNMQVSKVNSHEGTDPSSGWFSDTYIGGQLALHVPIPPPAEYLPTASQGTDVIKNVDPNTGQVTGVPIETSRTTQKVMGGQAPSPTAATPGSPRIGAPMALPGGGKKLSAEGQGMITSLTQATDLFTEALKFLDKPPSYVDWQKANIQYKAGADPGPGYANAFQAIGLARAIATGPLLHGIRNRAVIKGIQDHLPSLWDSPALVKQKMEDLLPFWKKAMDEVYKTENVKPPASAKSESDPLGILE